MFEANCTSLNLCVCVTYYFFSDFFLRHLCFMLVDFIMIWIKLDIETCAVMSAELLFICKLIMAD